MQYFCRPDDNNRLQRFDVAVDRPNSTNEDGGPDAIGHIHDFHSINGHGAGVGTTSQISENPSAAFDSLWDKMARCLYECTCWY